MTKVTHKKPVVALYLRVSTSQQDFEIQLGGLQEEAQKMGATIYMEYTDKGFGGDTQSSNRQYADDVIRDAALGKFQTLLVWKIDRIARDEEFGLNYLRRIEETGCKIRFVNEPNLNTPEVYTEQAASAIKSMRVMYLMGARMMLESIRTNTRAAKKSWIKANKWPSSQIPDGYTLNGKYGLKIDEPRAAIIRRIFDLYVDEKLTVRQIVTLLNNEGVSSATARKLDRKWVKDSVQDKLSNAVYIGKLPIRWKDKINKTSSVIHTFTCPPIISDLRFQEVQEMKKERIKRSRGNHKREFPFRPYVWCAACGYELHTLTSSANKPSESHHYGYRKPAPGYGTYKKRCRDGCGRISERNLVKALFNHVGRFFKMQMKDDYTPGNIDKVMEFLEGGDVSEINKKRDVELKGLTKELEVLRQKPIRIKDMYEAGDIHRKEYDERLARANSNPRLKIIEEGIRYIQQSLVGEKEQKRRMSSLAIWAAEVVVAMKIAQVGWDIVTDTVADYGQQREFTLQLLKYIKKIHIDFKHRRLRVESRLPKYLDGKVVFEADPVVAMGRPRKDSGGNTGGNNTSKQVASVS